MSTDIVNIFKDFREAMNSVEKTIPAAKSLIDKMMGILPSMADLLKDGVKFFAFNFGSPSLQNIEKFTGQVPLARIENTSSLNELKTNYKSMTSCVTTKVQVEQKNISNTNSNLSKGTSLSSLQNRSKRVSVENMAISFGTKTLVDTALGGGKTRSRATRSRGSWW